MLKRWVIAGMLLAATGPGGGAWAADPPASPPSNPFVARLMDSSLIIGVARTYPQMLILDKHASIGTDPTTEQYRGNGALTPSLSFWWLPGEHINLAGEPSTPNARFRTWMTIGGGADWVQFSGKQSLQSLPNGHPAQGTIHGDHVFLGLKFLGWWSWHNDFLPMAWGVSQGLGFEIIRFDGNLQFSSGPNKETATVSSGGLNLGFGAPFELLWQIGSHVRLRWMFSDTVLATAHDAKVTQGGSSAGNFEYQHRLSVYTLGYVWGF